ncbi:MAG: hypothetical protein JW940_04450 [Polyangiaceae bacterium]|nr:hypothetical protein [Polyangiaceae bacterium]
MKRLPVDEDDYREMIIRLLYASHGTIDQATDVIHWLKKGHDSPEGYAFREKKMKRLIDNLRTLLHDIEMLVAPCTEGIGLEVSGLITKRWLEWSRESMEESDAKESSQASE